MVDSSPGEAPWTSSEREILRKHVDEFRKGDKMSRKTLLQTRVLQDVKKLNSHLSADAWKIRKERVKCWFSNNGRRTSTKKMLQLGRKVSLKQVLGEEKGEEVRAAVMALSGGAPAGSRNYMGAYQEGLQNVMDGLTLQELQDLERKKEKWETEQYPPNVQKRMVRDKFMPWLRNIVAHSFRVFGVRMAVLEYHPGENGRLWMNFHDFTADFDDDLDNFTTFSSEIVQNMLESFASYICFADDFRTGKSNDGVRSDVNVQSAKRRKASLIQLEDDALGFPLLPPAPFDCSEELPLMKGIVRSYITKHYRQASGRNTDKVPWRQVADNPSSFFAETCMPPGVKLQDPSSMKKEQLTRTLAYWRNRQSELSSNRVFHFRQIFLDDKFQMAMYCSRGPDPREPKRKTNKGKAKATTPLFDETPNNSDMDDEMSLRYNNEDRHHPKSAPSELYAFDSDFDDDLDLPERVGRPRNFNMQSLTNAKPDAASEEFIDPSLQEIWPVIEQNTAGSSNISGMQVMHYQRSENDVPPNSANPQLPPSFEHISEPPRPIRPKPRPRPHKKKPAPCPDLGIMFPISATPEKASEIFSETTNFTSQPDAPPWSDFPVLSDRCLASTVDLMTSEISLMGTERSWANENQMPRFSDLLASDPTTQRRPRKRRELTPPDPACGRGKRTRTLSWKLGEAS